ncbi:hypothetical protein SAMN05444166_7500 [Singulisphaera sp. GP187]|nr:hypothetical protein SAMN05444166_7500 [Singulisphaera sp. GP187]
MGLSCAKCGSTEILTDIPVISDNLPTGAVSALAYRRPGARVFKRPITHPFLARVCGICGFAEFYVENPKGLLAVAKQVDTDV